MCIWQNQQWSRLIASRNVVSTGIGHKYSVSLRIPLKEMYDVYMFFKLIESPQGLFCFTVRNASSSILKNSIKHRCAEGHKHLLGETLTKECIKNAGVVKFKLETKKYVWETPTRTNIFFLLFLFPTKGLRKQEIL